MVPKPTPLILKHMLDRHKMHMRPHSFLPLIIDVNQQGGFSAAVIQGVIAGVQAVNALGQATHFTTKANDAINKKFSDHRSPLYTKIAHEVMALGKKIG